MTFDFGFFHRAFELFLIYYIFTLNGVYFFLSLIAFREVSGHLVRNLHYGGFERFARSPLTPGVSIIVPAHNEEVGIELTTNNLLHVDYMRFEVIVVNDGSTDRTLEKLREAFDLHPVPEAGPAALKTNDVIAVYKSSSHHNLTVVDKKKGGKADALNAGINVARHPYICSIDADAILEADALQRVVMRIMESPKRVVAVGGIVRIANGCRIEKGRITEIELGSNPLSVFQVIEYGRAFLCGRTGFSRLNALMIISGAFGLFERDLVVEIGGFRTDTVGEDMDLVTRLHALMREKGDKDYLIEFVPDPVCWTEVPHSLGVLARQRRRWQKGLLEVLSQNKKMLFNPRFGALGFFAYPFLYLFEGWGVLVEVAATVIFLAGWLQGTIQQDYMIAFLCVSFLCGTSLSLAGLLLSEMSPQPYPKVSHWIGLTAFALLENFGYRQLTSLLRVWGTWDYFTGAGGWGKMERQGLLRRRA